MLKSAYDLKIRVKNVGYPLPIEIGTQKSPIFGVYDNFATERQI